MPEIKVASFFSNKFGVFKEIIGAHEVCPFDSYSIGDGEGARSAPVPVWKLSGLLQGILDREGETVPVPECCSTVQDLGIKVEQSIRFWYNATNLTINV